MNEFRKTGQPNSIIAQIENNFIGNMKEKEIDVQTQKLLALTVLDGGATQTLTDGATSLAQWNLDYDELMVLKTDQVRHITPQKLVSKVNNELYQAMIEDVDNSFTSVEAANQITSGRLINGFYRGVEITLDPYLETSANVAGEAVIFYRLSMKDGNKTSYGVTLSDSAAIHTDTNNIDVKKFLNDQEWGMEILYPETIKMGTLTPIV